MFCLVYLPLSLHSIPTTFSTTAVHMDQNNTNITHCPKEESKEWVAIYVFLIAVLGILLNVFVLMVFFLHKKALTVAEIYLSSLAAVDLVLVSCLPFWGVVIIKKFHWPFGNLMCKLVNMGINMNVGCSIYFLVLIVIDRYMALVHPLSNDRFRRPKYAKLGCLLVLGFGVLLGVPTFIFRKTGYDNVNNITVCYMDYPNPRNTVHVSYEGILIFLRFILPICIISYCTLKIIKTLNNRVMQVSNNQKTEHKATTLVLVVLVAFLICWVPFHLHKILDTLYRVDILEGCDTFSILYIYGQIATYFAYFNSILNPILYIIVGKNFRKKVKELFKQRTITRTTLSLTSMRTTLMRSVQSKDSSS
ncbi:B2 bradykinin receptor-like [Scomber japonicus]|uniref:B2 bradykinin receptor-like n=1 Tax=Scomber japonicus TaxID=13676 RepID=UPI002305898E|nr:B2 bradykinin receptor-like [Scomber japonicus]